MSTHPTTPFTLGTSTTEEVGEYSGSDISAMEVGSRISEHFSPQHFPLFSKEQAERGGASGRKGRNRTQKRVMSAVKEHRKTSAEARAWTDPLYPPAGIPTTPTTEAGVTQERRQVTTALEGTVAEATRRIRELETQIQALSAQQQATQRAAQSSGQPAFPLRTHLNANDKLLKELARRLEKDLQTYESDDMIGFVQALSGVLVSFQWEQGLSEPMRLGETIRGEVVRKLGPPARTYWNELHRQTANKSWANGFEEDVFNEDEDVVQAGAFVAQQLGVAGMDKETITDTHLWQVVYFVVRSMADAAEIADAVQAAHTKLQTLAPEGANTTPADYARSLTSWYRSFPMGTADGTFPPEAIIVRKAVSVLRAKVDPVAFSRIDGIMGSALTLDALTKGCRAVKSLNTVMGQAKKMPAAPAVHARTWTKGSDSKANKGKTKTLPTPPQASSSSSSTFKGKCFLCREVGHRQMVCPQRDAVAAFIATQNERTSAYSSGRKDRDEDKNENESGREGGGSGPEPHPPIAVPHQYVEVTLSGPEGFLMLNGDQAALVDTGCTYSLLSLSTAEQLGLPIDQPQSEDPSIQDVQSRSVQTSGWCTVPVMFEAPDGEFGWVHEVRCMVIPDVLTNLILGASFMESSKVIPYLHEHRLYFEAEDVSIPMTTGTSVSMAMVEAPYNPVTADEFEIGEDVSATQRTRLLEILNTYPILVRGSVPRRFTPIEEAHVELHEGGRPYWRQTSTRSEHDERLLMAEVTWRRQRGLMRNIDGSHWSTPLFLVPKQGKEVEYDEDGNPLPGSMRLVQDLRKLNAAAVKEPNESMNIRQVIAKAGQHKYWVLMDLAKAFLSIKVAEEDQFKTAATLPNGETVVNVAMPMGYVNSPAIWNRVAAKAMGDMMGNICVWMDDLFYGEEDIDRALDKLETICKRLDSAGLTLSVSKLKFCVKEAQVLGLILSETGVGIKGPTKETMADLPRPKTTKELQSFMGIVNFVASWIPHCSSKTALLTQMLKKGHRLDWTPERIEAFEAIKKAIIESDPLAHVDELYKEGNEIVVATDASTRAVGAVLAARTPDGDIPVMFSARTLAQRELAQGVPDLELLGLVHGLAKFMPFIDGRAIVVLTDSQPLKGMIEGDAPADTRVRQRRLDFTRSFKIKRVGYIRGEDNIGPDALSRLRTHRPPEHWAAFADAEDAAVEKRLRASAAVGLAFSRSGRRRRVLNYKALNSKGMEAASSSSGSSGATGQEAADPNTEPHEAAISTRELGPEANQEVSDADQPGARPGESSLNPATAPTTPGSPDQERNLPEDLESDQARETSATPATAQPTRGALPPAQTAPAQAQPSTQPERQPAQASVSPRTGAVSGAMGAPTQTGTEEPPSGDQQRQPNARRARRPRAGPRQHPPPPSTAGPWTTGELPTEERRNLLLRLEELHGVKHTGRDGLIQRARAIGITEKGLTMAAKEVVAGCDACARFGAYTPAHGASGASVTAGVTAPNEQWSLDHAGYFKLGPNNQKSWILVAVDGLSGYRMTKMVTSLQAGYTADAVKAIMQEENVTHVAHLHADRGGAFVGRGFTDAFPNSTLSKSSAGHAQGNGLAEAGVKSTKTELKTTAFARGMTTASPVSEWKALLTQVTNEYNKTPRYYGPPHEDGTPRIRTTPYALFKGVDPDDEVGVRDDGDTPRADLVAADRIPIAERIPIVVSERKIAADKGYNNGRKPKTLELGQEVFIKFTNSSSAKPALERDRFTGPFIVIGQGPQIGPDNTILTYKVRSPYHEETTANGPGQVKKVNIQEIKPTSTMRWKAIKAMVNTPPPPGARRTRVSN